MRFLKALTLGALTIALATSIACNVRQSNRDAGDQTADSTSSVPQQQQRAAAERPTGGTVNSEAKQRSAVPGDVTFVKANAAGTEQPPVIERKIIRNAALTVEIDAPDEALRRVASIAEARGGFVVTSESRQHDSGGANGAKTYQTVTIEIRVPAAQFDTVVGEIRNVGGRVREEKITGQDVTEEYIDLEARIRTKKALEEQFLEIMKQARTVADALEVQTQIAEVRGEIERLEGRRRFLENQASLSTIKVTLQPQASFVNTDASGFFADIKEAFGDGIDLAAGFVLLLIRLAIVLIPVFLFLVLPIVLFSRYVIRRRNRRPPLSDEKPQPAETRV